MQEEPRRSSKERPGNLGEHVHRHTGKMLFGLFLVTLFFGTLLFELATGPP